MNGNVGNLLDKLQQIRQWVEDVETELRKYSSFEAEKKLATAIAEIEKLQARLAAANAEASHWKARFDKLDLAAVAFVNSVGE